MGACTGSEGWGCSHLAGTTVMLETFSTPVQAEITKFLCLHCLFYYILRHLDIFYL